MRDGDPPFYGQPNPRRRPGKQHDHPVGIDNAITNILGKIEGIMGLLTRQIAGISITEITDEVIVFPVEIVDTNTVLVKMQPTATTQAAERYVVQLKLDRGAVVDTLPLDSIIFTDNDVDFGQSFTIPFTVTDLAGIEGFIAEVFLDDAIADVFVPNPIFTGIGGTALHDLSMIAGSGGLAGYTIELTIADPSIAKFTGASFPPDFPLTTIVPDPVDGPVMTISAVDLLDSIGTLDDATLATLSIESLAIGETAINARVIRLDDDAGFQIRAIIEQGVVKVS